MLFNKEQIMDFLPHRDPFLFLDSIRELDLSNCPKQEGFSASKDLVGAKVVGEFTVRKEMAILKGHFPGRPLIPGVVEVEMMAQTSAFLSYPLVEQGKFSSYKVETLLLGIDQAKFRRPIVPGDTVEIFANLQRTRGSIANYEGSIYCRGELCAQALIMAKLEITKKENL